MNVDKRHNSITDNKKTITRWLILAILAFNCSMAAMAQNININATTFPDLNFRNWVLSQSYGADGELTPTEINNVTTIEIQNLGITDITGIEYFTALTTLRLGPGSGSNTNSIPNVDLSALNKLKDFYGRNSGITHLTLPTNKTELRDVYLQLNTGLTGTLDFTGYTALRICATESSNLEKLIFDGCTSMNFGSSPFNENLKYIDISNCITTSFSKGTIQLETFIAKNCTSLNNLTLNKSTVKYIDISGCTAFTSFSYKGANAKDNYNPLETFIARDCTNIKTLDIHNNSLTSVDVTGCTQLQNLNYPGNLLTYVDLSTNTELLKVEASNNLFLDLGVDPAIHTKLQKIIANRAGYASYHKALTFPVLTQMQLNGGAYVRLDKSTGEYKEMNEQSGHVSMLISEIQHIEHMPNIDKLLCRDNNLSVLNLHANPLLKEIELRHNRFLTLDLSNNTSVTSTFNIDDQRSVEDLVVFDRKKVAIYLPNALPTEDINRFSNLFIDGGIVANDASIYTDGSNKKYLVITTSDLEKRDLDLYEKTITYDYDTKFWDPARKMMGVTVTGNTYIMYISPDSGAPTGAHTYYSGTIYLQYESIVPEGVTAYVLTGVKDMGEISIDADGNAYTTDQLNTLQYAAPGDVLPANTPVYVVSANPGFYAFKKNYQREYHGWKYACNPTDGALLPPEFLWSENNRINPTVPGAPSVNLLTGTLTDKTIVSYSVLTLGREKTSRNVGFWMYTSTNIPAHRAYIELDTNIAGGISLPAYAKGYTLNFGNIINTQRR